MTIRDTLRRYLEESGESRRALSIRAGLKEKAVADILNIPGLKPRRKTLVALSDAIGYDLTTCLDEPPVTYADRIRQLRSEGRTREANRLDWLARSAGWVPETRIICRREAVEFLEAHGAAAFGLTPGSYSTYKSEAIDAVSSAASRQRRRSVSDIGGAHRAAYEAISTSDLPKWRMALAGPFLTFLHDTGVAVEHVETATLGAYYAHRLDVSPKSEEKCRRHILELVNLLETLSQHPDLKRFGFRRVDDPFEPSGGRYGVPDDVIAPLMQEFDETVAPWALGELSRTGQSHDDFITSLDRRDEVISDKKARLLKHQAERAARPGQKRASNAKVTDELLAAAGFLTVKQRWTRRTLTTRRGYIVALAKAIVASSEIVPETMEELTDPVFLTEGVNAIHDANTGEFPSGYLGSVLKCIRKIACFHQCRNAEDVSAIDALIEMHGRKHKGIAPRNRAKLRQFDDTRIQKTIDLSDTIITGVNEEIDRRRRAHRKKHGVLPARADVIDAELARDVMAAIAHDILLRRAPRSDNVTHARLDWIAWQGGLARLVIPAVEIKLRGPDDADLVIPLGERTSKLLRLYLDVQRPKALVQGDKAIPYLFPQQVRKKTLGQPYGKLLKRVTRILAKHVGVQIHPHLYRHLIGWIWLKDSLDHLPKVQRLLGHATLQTTIDYYAELDDGLVFDAWQAHINTKSGRKPRKAA